MERRDFLNQYSKCAPSLAVWNGKLHIAFVANDASNSLLVYFSSTPDDPKSWTATVVTHQTSANAPSLAVYPSGSTGKLYLAFVAENGSNDIFVCSCLPAAVGPRPPSPASLVNFRHRSLSGSLLSRLRRCQWQQGLTTFLAEFERDMVGAVALNQSTSATPCAVAFGSGLATGFVANNSSGEVLLAYSLNPSSSWTGGNVDIKQQSAAGPAVAVAPFACCHELLTYQGKIGGNTNYSFWAGLGSDNKPIPVTGLVVEINIDEPLVVSPTQGVPAGSPIGFQINGIPPIADQQPGQVTTGWTPTIGDKAIGWQQYGVKMWPHTTMLISWSQYWPPSVFQNPNVAATFTLSTPNSSTVTLPNNLTIPAGWKIRFTFKYSTARPGTITGFDCKVTDSNGNSVGPDMGIDFLASQNLLTTGKPITLDDLDQLVAFQVVLVGFYDSAQAVLTSGGGSITVQASTPLTVLGPNTLPADSSGNNGTAENANSTYGLLPACPSKSFTQIFGVS